MAFDETVHRISKKRGKAKIHKTRRKTDKGKTIERLTARLAREKKKNSVVIGIVSAPVVKPYMTKVSSYIPQSYVKWIEMSGARVVPLQYDLPKPVLSGFLNQLSGVLWIGGGIENKKTHTEKQFRAFIGTLHFIYKYIKQQNDIGNVYPLWGTCIGFEILALIGMYASADSLGHDFYHGRNIQRITKKGPGVLNFTDDTSSLAGAFTAKMRKEMAKKPSTYHVHDLGFDMKGKTMPKMEKYLDVLAIEHSDKGSVQFMNAFKYKDYPFYGVIFHPEKPPFEWIPRGIPHNALAVKTSAILSRFFVGICRKNFNIWIGGRFPTDYLIYNYNLYSRQQSLKLLEPKDSHLKNFSEMVSTYYFGSVDDYYKA